LISTCLKRPPKRNAVGYSYDAVKIFMPAGAKTLRALRRARATIRRCRDLLAQEPRFGSLARAWQIEASVGKYIISDRPMSAEDWVRERVTIVDAEPLPTEDKTEEK
jgi:hypothetical protein